MSEPARLGYALSALAAAGVLYALTRTERGQAAAVDALEGVTVTARRIAAAVLPRGIRNNNPGNIDWIENPVRRWRGMIRRETPEEGGRFAVFDTAANGVRAIGRELLLEAQRGAVTIARQIAVWAPSNENDTSAYARAVARELGVAPDTPLDISARLTEIVAAIIRHENGQQPYTLSDIAKWVRS